MKETPKQKKERISKAVDLNTELQVIKKSIELHKAYAARSKSEVYPQEITKLENRVTELQKQLAVLNVRL